jgi:hypothetical protein
MDLKEKISDLLNDKIINIEKINSWFLSQWFKLRSKSKTYFARNIIKKLWWFEYLLEDKKSFEISHFMSQNWNIKSYWVIEFEWSQYHITDFFEWNILWLYKMKESHIIQIAQKIWNIHKNWKLNNHFNDNEKAIYYKRSFREILTNPETLFSIYEMHIVWSKEKDFFKELIFKMLNTYFDYINNIDFNRLTTIHWDFWQGNFLINKDEQIEFIDFSRIPFWEPWIDIWWFLTQLDIDIIVQTDTFQSNYKKLFLQKYIEVTWDIKIENYLDLSRLWVWFIMLSPLTQSFLNWEDDKVKKVQDWLLKN